MLFTIGASGTRKSRWRARTVHLIRSVRVLLDRRMSGRPRFRGVTEMQSYSIYQPILIAAQRVWMYVRPAPSDDLNSMLHKVLSGALM